jgi:hypothetical protein
VLAVMDTLLPEQAETLPEGSFFALPGGAYGDGEIAAEFEDGDLEIPAAPPQEFTEMVAMEVLEGTQTRKVLCLLLKRALRGFFISTCNDHYDEHYARSFLKPHPSLYFLFQLLVFILSLSIRFGWLLSCTLELQCLVQHSFQHAHTGFGIMGVEVLPKLGHVCLLCSLTPGPTVWSLDSRYVFRFMCTYAPLTCIHARLKCRWLWVRRDSGSVR